MRIACIGECMLELSEVQGDLLSRGYGGDTLNTAVYLARLGVPVDYCTVLGDDPFSDEMIAGWQGEGIGTELVLRLPGRVPGLYLIRRDAHGERSFFYWRGEAPARQLFELPQTGEIEAALTARDLLYLSGITLSLYGTDGRERLFATLARARAAGARVAFDTNFRPRGWPDRALARAVYGKIFELADQILASAEDLELLFGNDRPPELLMQAATKELVLKLKEPGCRVLLEGAETMVPAPPVAAVVDTTAAGDSFAAGYLAARLAGCAAEAAARVGHRLAGTVIGHQGAIIPRTAMPALALAGPCA